MTTTQTSIERTLRAALNPAMRARDSVAVSALRTALAAIANAEAVDVTAHSMGEGGSRHVAGAVVGVGAAEVARRQLHERDVRAIVQLEVDSRRSDADELERHGATDRARSLREEAEVLAAVLRHVPEGES